MGRKISRGLKASKTNPSTQDFIEALKEGPRSALKIYKQYTEKQYQHIKAVMDPLEPYLPIEVVASWRAIEAIHDEYLA